MNTANSFNTASVDKLQNTFLTVLLPKLQLHAQIVFNNIRCPVKRADKIAEVVALGWKRYLRLNESGKDVTLFAMVFVFLAARAVKSGRRVCGREKSRDVMSSLAQQKHGFSVESLPTSLAKPHEDLYAVDGQRPLDAYEERLRDNMITPILEQVQFRIDFPAWLKTLTGRERRMIRVMMRNERTKDVSKQFEVSPGRVSQLLQEFKQGWERYCGDTEEQVAAVA